MRFLPTKPFGNERIPGLVSSPDRLWTSCPPMLRRSSEKSKVQLAEHVCSSYVNLRLSGQWQGAHDDLAL